MRRDDVDKFLADASKRVQAAKDGRVPPEYLTLLEAQFHRMDNERTRIPLWPCNLDLVPAPSIREMVGPASYRLYNYGLAEHFWLIRHVCGFRGDQHLLDVGCGFGKTAIALLRLIRPPGSYIGFDIQPKMVEFANTLFKQLGVSDRFRAECYPMENTFYRGGPRPVRAETFEFPYETNQFDCAVLHSVFTHMLSQAVANYVRNLARVVKPGGRILVSVFLLDNSPEAGTGGEPWADSERRGALQEMLSPIHRGRLRVLKPENPEYMVAYRLEYLTTIFEKFGCRLVGEPLWGSWSGRSDSYCYQDYLLFQKKGGRAAEDEDQAHTGREANKAEAVADEPRPSRPPVTRNAAPTRRTHHARRGKDAANHERRKTEGGRRVSW